MDFWLIFHSPSGAKALFTDEDRKDKFLEDMKEIYLKDRMSRKEFDWDFSIDTFESFPSPATGDFILFEDTYSGQLEAFGSEEDALKYVLDFGINFFKNNNSFPSNDIYDGDYRLMNFPGEYNYLNPTAEKFWYGNSD